MLTQIINGKIFTPQGWLDEGSVLIRDNKILEVTNCDLALIGAKLIDAKGMYIVPGYVCMHAHGGGGHDFNECTEEAFRAAIRAHQKHGATSIFPTLSSSPFSEIRKAVAVCETLMNEKDSPVLGLHVEGDGIGGIIDPDASIKKQKELGVPVEMPSEKDQKNQGKSNDKDKKDEEGEEDGEGEGGCVS